MKPDARLQRLDQAMQLVRNQMQTLKAPPLDREEYAARVDRVKAALTEQVGAEFGERYNGRLASHEVAIAGVRASSSFSHVAALENWLRDAATVARRREEARHG